MTECWKQIQLRQGEAAHKRDELAIQLVKAIDLLGSRGHFLVPRVDDALVPQDSDQSLVVEQHSQGRDGLEGVEQLPVARHVVGGTRIQDGSLHRELGSSQSGSSVPTRSNSPSGGGCSSCKSG